jgi:phosphoribosylaminoimidazole carboxylase PurE protein
MKPKVLIVAGSDSDLPVVEEAQRMLKDFGVPYQVTIASAHRSPELVDELASGAEEDGFEVVIAAAGMAAHLAGAIAARTALPVIGVPLSASSLGGIESLLSMAQMPSGVPVATMAIGKAGARNAALFAVRILARKDSQLQRKLHDHRKKMASDVKGLRAPAI